jgi:hypothetical protein
LLGLLFDPEDGGDIFFPKSRAFSELHGATTQKIVLFNYFAEFNYLLFVIAALVQLTLFRTLFKEAQDVFTLLRGAAAPYDGYFFPFRWKLG